jgi:hypothetical protein
VKEGRKGERYTVMKTRGGREMVFGPRCTADHSPLPVLQYTYSPLQAFGDGAAKLEGRLWPKFASVVELSTGSTTVIFNLS